MHFFKLKLIPVFLALLCLCGCGTLIIPTIPYGSPLPELTAVDDQWFANSAMIGHSLMQGMDLYSGLETPDYYTQVGATASSIQYSKEVTLPDGSTGTLAQGLEGKTYERFYLFFGINEVGDDVETLRADYQELLDLVWENSPEADVYILNVLPVTESKAAEGVFTLEKITAYNQMLSELCEENACWYVDLYSCFANASGYLSSKKSSDGIHLYPAQYLVLSDYLKTHAIG